MIGVVGARLATTEQGAAGAASPTSSTRSRTTTTPAGSRPTGSTRCPPAGWFGQGIGASQQKWGDLPEAHTDFIFAVLGEELGLVGTLLVIGLFLTIAYAAIRVATRTDDPFVRYMSFGIVVWLLGQMMINVGMVLALLPVIGIPLPLVSYGGSALLPSLVALGPAGRLRPPRAGGRARPCGSGAGRRGPLSAGLLARDEVPPRLISRCASFWPAAAPPATPRPCSPPPTPCAGSTRTSRSPASAPRAASRPAWSPRPATRSSLIPPVPLPRKPSADLLQVPGRLRGAVTGDARGPRPGPPRRGRRLRRLRLDAGLPRRPPPGLPLVVHEQNALPGLANKVGARVARRVAVSFPDTPLPQGGVRRPADPHG